jgi:hypothetical protein
MWNVFFLLTDGFKFFCFRIQAYGLKNCNFFLMQEIQVPVL